MEELNGKAKSYTKFVFKSSNERIELARKANEIISELDKHKLEVSFIKEKPHKIILSVGNHNLVIQNVREKTVYLLFDFDSKSRVLSTSSVEEFKEKISTL